MVVWQIGALFQVLEQQVQLISIKMDLQVPNHKHKNGLAGSKSYQSFRWQCKKL
jgi:hypothetical protein